MKTTKWVSFKTSTLILLIVFAVSTPHVIQGRDALATLEDSGVKGGLIVHIGCGDPAEPGFTAAMRATDSFLVHGLTRNPRDLARARKNIRNAGLYGPVSADLLEGNTLPYIDNSVNLIVAEKADGISEQEMLRVLVPNGVAYVSRARAPAFEGGSVPSAVEGTPSTQWTKIVKQRPDNIDEWTHYMHDPSNNAVAHDTAIGPLRHLQWDGAPQYSRHHEFTSSVAAMVSANGRLFSIMDMGSRASIHMPAKWRLTARDAFNGIVLWEKPIESWFNHLWPLKDGPAQPPRRLVAVGDSVYVTLGLEAPVSRLDAATGRILQTYEGTEFTEEIIACDGTLFLLKNDKSMNPKDYHPYMMICWDEKNRTMKDSEGYLLKLEPRHIIAIDAETGKQLWNVEHPVEPLTLAVDETSVYFHNWNQVVALNRKTGRPKWKSDPVDQRKSMGYVYGPTLVSYEDVVLFADGRLKRRIRSLAKENGRLLWEAPHYPAGHAGSPEDLLVVDGLVWCGKIAGGGHDGVFTGRDPRMGEVKREFTPDVETYWFHHRCYRSKATDEYILTSRTGIEFVDVRDKTWETHHWVRGACTYGIVPCNGLVYAPPHPCACYLDAKLSGLCALAPSTQRTGKMNSSTQRLIRGPAYGQIENLESQISNPQEWPTYRHDTARSGTTEASVKLPLSRKWRTDLDGELTSPVVADSRVFVASRDNHTLHALSAETGDEIWTFTTGAGVDSPPSVGRGLVIFGCADGRIYCLWASDGALVWKFRAAPSDMRLVSYGRLESVWPVHGSVLVCDGIVYCVAGRSTFLDGGLRFLRLDAATGRLLSEKVYYDQASPQKDVKVLNMPVALPDVLSTDGELIYMRSQVLDLQGNRIQTIDPTLDPLERATKQLGRGAHLFCPTGFLDPDAWHRSYWMYGRAFSSGCDWWFRAGRYAPAGRLLVFEDDRVYGFGRETGLFVWSHVLENHLFCSDIQADAEAIERVRQWSVKTGRNARFDRSLTRGTPLKSRHAPNLKWSVKQPPLHVRAMILADDTLFVAGPPDVLNEDDAFNQPFDAKIVAQIVEQDAAYEGKRGALLLGFSTEQGRECFRLDLPSPPVWDGMAAAEGKLFVCDADGNVTCLGAK